MLWSLARCVLTVLRDGLMWSRVNALNPFIPFNTMPCSLVKRGTSPIYRSLNQRKSGKASSHCRFFAAFLHKACAFCWTTVTGLRRPLPLPFVAPQRSARRSGGVVGALRTIGREEGFSALWAGTTPRVARSVLSGAIQFGSYEFVKGLFGVEPRKL